MATEFYPSGRSFTFGYDAAARLNSVISGATTYASDFAYTPHSGIKSFKLGNALWEYAAYNNRLQPETMGLGVSSGDLSKLALGFTYGLYDSNNGNVKTQTVAFNGWQATQTYGYDHINRLTSASEVQNAGGTNWYQNFGYDRYGNQWQSSTNVPTNALIPTAEGSINQGNNRLNGMTYDDTGNLTDAANTWHFTYDAENRQTAARVTVAPGTQTTYSYAYDGDGRRVKRNVPGHTDVYVYDAFGALAAEYQDGAWLKDFVYMGGKLLMVDDAKQGVSYLTTDHLGSTRLVTGPSGNVISRHDYLPFGKEVPLDFGRRRDWGGYETTGPAEHVMQRFTGKELDPETGLDFFGARYYSGRQGRFTTPDWSEIPQPIPYADLHDPQTLNLYGYVRNNPLRIADADGHGFWSKLGNVFKEGCFCETDAIIEMRRQYLIDRHVVGIDQRGMEVEIDWTKVSAKDVSSSWSKIRNTEMLDSVIDTGRDALGLATAVKPVNLPGWKRVGIDMDEILSGHTAAGARAQQSAKAGGSKDLFPKEWSAEKIEKAVREAYRNSQKIRSQGQRVLMEGQSNGRTIQMWVNKATRTIETAWPK